jgi:hypothetical protein
MFQRMVLLINASYVHRCISIYTPIWADFQDCFVFENNEDIFSIIGSQTVIQLWKHRVIVLWFWSATGVQNESITMKRNEQQ